MMAYGLGRNIALLQTQLQSFNPPLIKRIKLKNLLLTIIYDNRFINNIHISKYLKMITMNCNRKLIDYSTL